MKELTPEAKARLGKRTRLMMAGRHPDEQFGFVNTPIYRGSTVLAKSAAEYRDRTGRFNYGRQESPTIASLEEAWTELTGAAGTVLVPSGLAAVATSLLAVTQAGGHVLVTDSAYYPTRRICQKLLKRFGVTTTFYDPAIGAGIADLIRPETTAVYVESPGSLTFEVQDIPAIAEAAHARRAAVLMDNTWATPLFFDAHAKGVDICIEAGTKYASGASDMLLGMISVTEAYLRTVRDAYADLGNGPGPEDVFLALRGLRSLPLRLAQHQSSALVVAEWLSGRPEVEKVLYPALPGAPGHELWKRDFTGASGLFSIVLRPALPASVDAFVDGMTLFGIGASWGGYESLVTLFDGAPIRSTGSWTPAGPTLRLHIGLEDPQDLIADLEAGLARLEPA
jgi:cystathionine beta-lyase